MYSHKATLIAVCICISIKSQVMAQLPDSPILSRSSNSASADGLESRLEQQVLLKLFKDGLTSELSRKHFKISLTQLEEIKELHKIGRSSEEFNGRAKQLFTAEQILTAKRQYLSNVARFPLDIFTDGCFSFLQISENLNVTPEVIAKYRSQLKKDLNSRLSARLVDYAQLAPDSKKEEIWNYFGVDFVAGKSKLPPEKLLLIKPKFAMQFIGFVMFIVREEKLLEDEEHIRNLAELRQLYISFMEDGSKTEYEWFYSDALSDMSNEAKVKTIQLYQQYRLTEDVGVLLAPQLLNVMGFSKEAIVKLKKDVPQWNEELQQFRIDSELKLARELMKSHSDQTQKRITKTFQDVWDLSLKK